MKNIIFISIIITSSFVSLAQRGKLKKADKYYQKIAYIDAAILYSKLLNSKADSPEMRGKLADCYYQIGETDKAEMYYAQMINSSEVNSIDLYQYSQSLKENGKYEESDIWMEKFYKVSNNDLRVKEYVANKTYVQQIKTQGAYFKINLLQVNTKHAEFGGYPFQDKSYFITNRKKRISVQRVHTWNNKGFLDVYSANVAADGEMNNPIFHSTKTNKKFHEGPLCFTNDGKTVYFTRNNMKLGKNRKDTQGIQNLKIYKAIVTNEGNWIKEEELLINSKDYSVGHPSLSSDGKTMYFVSDKPGGYGGSDLYKMTINEDGTFGKPENLGDKINTEGQEMFPWASSEGLLFFASDGHVGLGGLDNYVVIPNKDGSIKKLMNIGMPVNSSKDDFALIMNPDNLTGYVSSNRITGAGDDDIYAFNLLKPLKVNLSTKGLVVDKKSNEVIPGALVDLFDAEGKLIASTITDENGGFEFGLEPDLNYSIHAHKEDYFDESRDFTTLDLPEGVEMLEENLTIEKDPGLALYALVSNAKTKEPLQNVIIIITDNLTGKEFFAGATSLDGEILKGITDKKIDDRLSYNIEISKEGFFPKTFTFNHKIDKPGVIDVANLLDGGLFLDKEVKDLAELIDINPINFDLNKSVIRPDAKIELNKIVAVMNKYPGLVVELGSHTDCRASKAYNRKLSDRRAKSSAAYIKTKITNPERIYGKGYGEEILLNGCECEGSVKSDCSEEEHEKNRRTEFKVISVGNTNVDVQNNSTDSFEK